MRTANLAIVFTDVIGYADRLSRQTYEQSQRMLRLHEALVLPVFRAFGGRRVKAIGGTFLVVFESPTQAVLCGAAVQDRLWEWNQGVPEGERIKIRIGANVGEVRLEKGDVFGEPVNIAARVESLADAGEVLFTEAIWLSMNRNEVETDDGGFQTLKGVPDPVRIFRVKPQPDLNLYPYGGAALAKAGHLSKPDPTRFRSSEIVSHLRAAAEQAGLRFSETFPFVADYARFFAGAAIVAAIGVAAALLAPDAIERALSRADLDAAQREVQAMRAGPRRTYYEGRVAEERKDHERAARSFELATRGGERRSFQRLLAMAEKGPCEARVAAARALGRLGDAEAVPVLHVLSEDRRDEEADGLFARVMGCNSQVAARDALEQIQAGGAP